MKAVVVRSWDPVKFEIEKLECPAPGEDEVLIAVHTSPINFGDVLIATGQYQVKPVLPFTPGAECSGVVEAVGSNVSKFKVGDRVMAMGFVGDSREERRILGSFAQKVIAREDNLVLVPAVMPLREASMIRGNYETAYYGLQLGRVAQGTVLLVLGGGGGTGYAAVTIGKAMGAYVIASSSSPERRSLALEGGADVAIDASASDWREQVRKHAGKGGVDIVYDPVGGDWTERAFRTIGWGGRHIVVGFAAGSIAKLPANLALLKGGSLIGANMLGFREKQRDEANENLQDIIRMLTDGRISHPKVHREYPLENVVQALSDVENFRGAGRIILTIGSDR